MLHVMKLGRRGLLVVAAATLAGCAPGPRVDGAGAQPSASRLPSAFSPVPPPSTTPPPPPEPSGAPPLPTRADIVDAFSGQAPSQWGLEVEGVVLRSEAPDVCLTFDACGGRHGSGFDEELIAVLEGTGTPATLFLNSRWIQANPQTTRDLVANPLFELANHGSAHIPLSVTGRSAYGIVGTGSVGEVYDEVAENQVLLTSLLGAPPRFFRSGTAHVDEVAARIVLALGLVPVNFDINADAGATFTARQVRVATATARAGSICIGHVNRPGSGTAAGIAASIEELRARGLTFSTLGDALVS
ncbi:polysaccharide deacetylase family protein [Tessaracoccus sp.]